MPAFTMPQLGESDVEGTVLKWLKQPGDHVKADEPLVEVETEKVNVEIPSPFEGTLTQILVAEGDTVPVGAELAIIGEAGVTPVPPASPAAASGNGVRSEPAAAPAAPASEPAREPAVAAEPTERTIAATATHVSRDGRNGSAAGPEPAGEGRFSPAVLRLAAEHRIDLKAVPGTGMNGRITRKDVMQFIERGGPPSAPASAAGEPVPAAPEPARSTSVPQTPSPSAAAASVAAPTPPAAPAPASVAPTPSRAPAAAGDDEEIIKPSATRLTIARNMVRSAQTIPTAWMVVEMDVTRLVKLREGAKEEFRRREGVDLSYLPFIIKAVVEALKAHPMLNSQWRDDQIVLKKRINMGVAVGSDDGLIVPVIHNADRLSIAGLAHAVVDLATRVRSRKLRLEDVQGGTFTLDNTGVFGSLVSQPIINPPQCAILSTEAIIKRPVVLDDAIAIRSMMNMCIAFDHRIVDGTHVGPFMQAIKKRLEGYAPDTAIW
jgi:2-oxoisovalerate dehydrogenase E2 component (dihydrolipoyl transacylase)